MKRGAYVGPGLVLLGAVAGLLWTVLRPKPAPAVVQTSSVTAPKEEPPPPHSPPPPEPAPPATQSIRGVVRNLRGPVAGVAVLATAVEPGKTLSELTREVGGTRGLSERYLPSSSVGGGFRFMRRVAAREGESRVMARTISAADGSFQLEGLPVGSFTLWADGAQGAAVPQDVASGRQDAVLELREGHRPTGQVLDEDHHPMEGVRVTAVHEQPTRFFDAFTDGEGVFHFDPLPPGRTWLVFTHQGRISEFRRPRDLFDPLVLQQPRKFSGRVLQTGAPVAGVTVELSNEDEHLEALSDAQGRFSFEGLCDTSYTLRAVSGPQRALRDVSLGGPWSEKVTLDLMPSGFVEGVVRDQGGRPLADASVSYRLNTRVPEFEAKTDKRGHYRLGPLPWGEYQLSGDAEGYGYVYARVTLDAPVVAQDFTLRDRQSVTGIAEDEEGRRMPDLWIQLRDARGVSLVKVGFEVFQHGIEATASTDAEGAFLLSAPEPGDYEVVVSDDSVVGGSQKVSAPASDVRVVVHRGCEITGELLDEAGDPVEDAEIISVDLSNGDYQGRVRRVRTGERGDFRLPGLLEGRYLLYASSEEDGGLREVSTRVRTRKGQPGRVQLRYKAGRDWTVQIEDRQGRPIEGVWLELSSVMDGFPSAVRGLVEEGAALPETNVVTGADGRFTFRHLVADRYELAVQKEGYLLESPRPSKDSDSSVFVRVSAGERRFVLSRE